MGFQTCTGSQLVVRPPVFEKGALLLRSKNWVSTAGGISDNSVVFESYKLVSPTSFVLVVEMVPVPDDPDGKITRVLESYN